jgi:hypothetical protein
LIIGIAMDDWKLPFFMTNLTEAGYTYTQHFGLTNGTFLLKVVTDDPEKLDSIVRAANAEAVLYRHSRKKESN